MLKFSKYLIFLLAFSYLNSCGDSKFLNPDWSKTAEPDGKKRARQNVEEGRGLKLFKKDKGGGNFLFASSNPLWRSSLEALDFMILSNVDYAGGIIITDWYSDGNERESIKITIKFLTNEVRSDALVVQINKKTCNSNNQCTISKIDNSLNFEIKKKILKQAAIYQVELEKTLRERNKPMRNPVSRE